MTVYHKPVSCHLESESSTIAIARQSGFVEGSHYAYRRSPRSSSFRAEDDSHETSSRGACWFSKTPCGGGGRSRGSCRMRVFPVWPKRHQSHLPKDASYIMRLIPKDASCIMRLIPPIDTGCTLHRRHIAAASCLLHETTEAICGSRV